MYYPYSENKDADQLRGYREADLRLCFRPCKLLVFSRTCSYIVQCHASDHRIHETERVKQKGPPPIVERLTWDLTKYRLEFLVSVELSMKTVL